MKVDQGSETRSSILNLELLLPNNNEDRHGERPTSALYRMMIWKIMKTFDKDIVRPIPKGIEAKDKEPLR